MNKSFEVRRESILYAVSRLVELSVRSNRIQLSFVVVNVIALMLCCSSTLAGHYEVSYTTELLDAIDEEVARRRDP